MSSPAGLIISPFPSPRPRSRYSPELSLEDAIHTSILTLKESFEGQMTEKTIEIGIIGATTTAKVGGGEQEKTMPVFRKLTEDEIRDYLAL